MQTIVTIISDHNGMGCNGVVESAVKVVLPLLCVCSVASAVFMQLSLTSVTVCSVTSGVCSLTSGLSSLTSLCSVTSFLFP